MMKDYVLADPDQREEDFVAAFWDERWQSQRQIEGRKQNLNRSDEWKFVRRAVSDVSTRLLDILDCGCGRGEWSLFLKGLGHRVVGIDIAKDIISSLQEQFRDDFRFGDFRNLDFPDDSFDLIINWGGMEHFEEGPAQTILEAWRVLRTGGWFVASTPCHNLRHFLRDALGKRTTGPEYSAEKYRFYQYRFTRGELENYFKACGFTRVRSRIIGGASGFNRCLQHELGWIGNVLSRKLRAGFAEMGGILLRPVVGHMVICAGTKRSSQEHRNSRELPC
jgi:SAM-dependent methyltransferase